MAYCDLPLGIFDGTLNALAKCTSKYGNECRSLHRLIHSRGMTLGVQVKSVPVPVLDMTGKPKKIVAQYPVLMPSCWVKCVFEQWAGQPLLGGHCLDDECAWRNMSSTFWARWENVRPDMEVFSTNEYDLSLCVPLTLHGDEGRGKLRRPVMITAVQPLISWKGPLYTNSSG